MKFILLISLIALVGCGRSFEAYKMDSLAGLGDSDPLDPIEPLPDDLRIEPLPEPPAPVAEVPPQGPPTSAPPVRPKPPTGPPPIASDEKFEDFDIRRVTWLHTNVSKWKITSKITKFSISPSKVCIDHTKKGQWPRKTIGGNVIVEGNPWVIVKRNGRWYAATYEWLRPGSVCKTLSSRPPSVTVYDQFGNHIKKSPLSNWRPRSGEIVGFMVSALARAGAYKALERTNIVFKRIP